MMNEAARILAKKFNLEYIEYKFIKSKYLNNISDIKKINKIIGFCGINRQLCVGLVCNNGIYAIGLNKLAHKYFQTINNIQDILKNQK